MGPSISKNVVKLAADMSAEVLNQTFQSLKSEAELSQNVSFGDGCEFNRTTVNQKQIVQIDKTAVQKAFNSTQVKQTIKAKISQIAETVVQNFSLNFSAKESESFAELFFDLSTSVVNVVSQDCSDSFTQDQSVTCDAASGGASVNDVVVNQTQVSNAVSKCMQGSQAITDIAQKIDVAFDQSASVTEKNALAWLSLIIGIVIVFIIMFAQTGKTIIKRVTNWKFIVAVTPVLLFAIYLIVASQTDRWPFNRTRRLEENDNIVELSWDGTDDGDESKNEMKTAAELCAEYDYHSVAYVLEPQAYEEDPSKEIKVITYNINKPMLVFNAFCRIKPSKLSGCKKSEWECPGQSLKPCCEDADGCMGDGRTGCTE